MADDGVQRRLTTILAADVVGYSRMMAVDEEAVVRTLEERVAVFRELVPRRGGRVFKTAGDGVLAEFDSPVEAVRCAVELQEQMRSRNEALPDERRMRFRIGINLGDVVVKEGDLLGDGVNIAARLEALAQPDGICVSSGVYEQILGKLTIGVQDLGAQQVKNIPRPVHAFALRLDGGGVPLSTATSGPATRRSLVPLLAAAAAILLLLGGGAAWWMLQRPAPTGTPAAGTPPPPPAIAVAKPGQPPVVGPETRPGLPPQGSPTMPPGPAPGGRMAKTEPSPLIPERIPFVLDRNQRAIRDTYLPAPDFKAIAISMTGTLWFMVGQPTEEAARQAALDNCNKNSREPCNIYAVGDKVVWPLRLPVLPPEPFLPPPMHGPPITLDPAKVPLLQPPQKEFMAKTYMPHTTTPKALALGPHRGWFWIPDPASETQAVRRVLETCGARVPTPCQIYAVGDRVLVAVPQRFPATGLLSADPLALMPEPARDRVRREYMIEADWRALALARNGKLGMAIRRTGEIDAVEAAIKDCAQAGGTDCEVYAIGPFRVTRPQ